MYELEKLYGLVPDVTPYALLTGRKYHNLVEMAIKGEPLPHDASKEEAMAAAFRDIILPSLPHDIETEEWVSGVSPSGHDLTGRLDGFSLSEGMVIEHKSTSAALDAEYAEQLRHDGQALMYCMLKGVRKYCRTAVRKPTIRLKAKETQEEFFRRMLEWYNDAPEDKAGMFKVEFSEDEIWRFQDELDMMIDEVEGTGYFWRNPCHCSAFGRRCSYEPVCHEVIKRDEPYYGFHWKEDENGTV
jgi:hypothetical protein